MSRGLFGEDKGSGFTVCCFRFSVMGWETAQTELGPPMGGCGGASGSLGRGVVQNKETAQTELGPPMGRMRGMVWGGWGKGLLNTGQ